jgi:Uri superfamily endonuclease
MLAPPFVSSYAATGHSGRDLMHRPRYFTRVTDARRFHVRRLDVSAALLTLFYITRGKCRLSSLVHFFHGYLAYVETNRCVETSTTKLFSLLRASGRSPTRAANLGRSHDNVETRRKRRHDDDQRPCHGWFVDMIRRQRSSVGAVSRPGNVRELQRTLPDLG